MTYLAATNEVLSNMTKVTKCRAHAESEMVRHTSRIGYNRELG